MTDGRKEFADITDTSKKTKQQLYSAADTEINQKERQQGENVSRALGLSLIRDVMSGLFCPATG